VSWPVRLRGTENRHKTLQKSRAEVRLLGGLRSPVLTAYHGMISGTGRCRSSARVMQNRKVCGSPKFCESQPAHCISTV
jgi:hypothetical protein